MVSAATSSLQYDIGDLMARKEAALSGFRQTAVDLDNVNCGLRDKVSKLDELDVFIASQRSAATQMIQDNDAVRQRILDIIGE
jgi:hypothetical protein